MSDTKLTFTDFSIANLTRCTSPLGFNHQLDDWHPSQWTNAIAGEAGEACNVSKKILRKPGQCCAHIASVFDHGSPVKEK